MDKFSYILKWLPIGGTSTSSTLANMSATSLKNPIPSSTEFASSHGGYQHSGDHFLLRGEEWSRLILVGLVSSIDHRLDQNVLRNLLSQYEMIECGIPKCTHTHSKKSLVMASVVIFYLEATTMAIFKNLLMTTKKKVVSMLSRRKARHVIHGDGFPRSTRGR